MPDWTAGVFRPLYAEFGVTATLLAVGSPADDHDISAIDRTAGVTLALGVDVETVRPSATIIAADLAALGLTADDLDDAIIRMNSVDWRIQSVQPLPSTNGEADGEYLLMLEAA